MLALYMFEICAYCMIKLNNWKYLFNVRFDSVRNMSIEHISNMSVTFSNIYQICNDDLASNDRNNDNNQNVN